VRIELPYAAPELSACEVPADRLSAVYRMADPPGVPDLLRELSAALASPVGAPRLARLAAGRGRIAVLMERWVDRVGLEFIVNCVLTPDDRVFRVVTGHYRDAQRAGVALAREVYSRQIRERVDIVVSAAHAHDLDFWPAAKGIYGPEPLVRDGGTLLLVSPCPEGMGPHPGFLERIGRDDNRAILLGILAGGTPPPDPISLAPAAMMAKMRRRSHCGVVSPGLPAPLLAQAGYEKFDDVQSGLETLLARYPQGRVAVALRSDLTFF
jgi:hypothetical protein